MLIGRDDEEPEVRFKGFFKRLFSIFLLKTKLDWLIVVHVMLWVWIPLVVFVNRYGRAVDRSLADSHREYERQQREALA